ncbi:hypothetical protein DPMN_147364 [Dreissena polymorpha]|uniref:Uncharacterized protein n=1 Tax=Dreissena polymorpha TaxID=45954 RepID=A0A9D4F8W9_DREPO|nr:hypothetical protein DPMN_147364 [Dreissena polymorpha]
MRAGWLAGWLAGWRAGGLAEQASKNARQEKGMLMMGWEKAHLSAGINLDVKLPNMERALKFYDPRESIGS